MTALYGDGRVRCATPTPGGVCGHLDVFHNLAGDKRTRTACSHHEGPKATPCGCKRFTPEVSP